MSEPARCATCGEPVPAEARFCPSCGARRGAGDTAVVPPPPAESGRPPAAVVASEPHLYGVTPMAAVLTVGLAAVAVGIVLLVAEETLVGAVLLGLGALAVASFVAAAVRTSGVARAVRARASYAGAAVAARSTARREVARLHRELDELARARGDLLRQLGEAVYGGREEATDDLRRRIADNEQAAGEKERAIDTVLRAADEQVVRARFETSRTEIVAVEEPSPSPGQADPPEPARIPEPYPPPDEADPPEPARVPEPYPPPGEADPPETPSPPGARRGDS